MKDIMGLMKQAKEMQEKMQLAQAEVADLTVEGRSGGGVVSISLAGGGNMKGISIDPSLIQSDEAEILEDLIIAAYHDAKAKLDQAQADKMKHAFGDMQLPPGMKMPF